MDMPTRVVNSTLKSLQESGVINTPERNLRSKMASLIRSIKNLEEKRTRIDYELRKQKNCLARKRLELKKDSRVVKARQATVSEATIGLDLFESPTDIDTTEIDNYLFRESARIVDD